jgi:hypothetical protein
LNQWLEALYNLEKKQSGNEAFACLALGRQTGIAGFVELLTGEQGRLSSTPDLLSFTCEAVIRTSLEIQSLTLGTRRA